MTFVFGLMGFFFCLPLFLLTVMAAPPPFRARLIEPETRRRGKAHLHKLPFDEAIRRAPDHNANEPFESRVINSFGRQKKHELARVTLLHVN